MALIACPECKKQVSEKADKCLHCGYKFKVGETERIRKEETKIKFFVFSFIVVLTLFFWIKCA